MLDPADNTAHIIRIIKQMLNKTDAWYLKLGNTKAIKAFISAFTERHGNAQNLVPPI